MFCADGGIDPGDGPSYHGGHGGPPGPGNDYDNRKNRRFEIPELTKLRRSIVEIGEPVSLVVHFNLEVANSGSLNFRCRRPCPGWARSFQTCQRATALRLSTRSKR